MKDFICLKCAIKSISLSLFTGFRLARVEAEKVNN